MPQFDNRTFSRYPNNMRDASDLINRKRAEGLYTTVATNSKTNIKDNIAVITRKGSINPKCVKSVGGFNVNSYSLLLDITKGRYFTATSGRKITINNLNYSGTTQPLVNSKTDKINDCSNSNIAITNTDNSSPVLQTSDLYEGNYIVNKSNYVNDITKLKYCDCQLPTLFDLSGIGIDSTPINNGTSTRAIIRLVNREPLRGFEYPSTQGLNLPI